MRFALLAAASVVSAASASIFSGSSDLEASASFPADNPLSVVFNGQPNTINVRLVNHSKKSLAISQISGAFSSGGKHLGNSTAAKYTLVIPPEGNRAPVDVPYSFYSELKPQDCGFVVYVDYKDSADVNIKNSPSQRQIAYDGSITVREPKGSLFDIQLLILYPLLIAILGLPLYWGYTAFVGPKLFGSKATTRAKRAKSTSVVAKSPTPRAVSPGPGGKEGGAYDESWIPEHHQAFLTRRSVSGRNLVKKGTAGITPTASGNATSDGETSGAEGTAATPRRSARANKGKKA